MNTLGRLTAVSYNVDPELPILITKKRWEGKTAVLLCTRVHHGRRERWVRLKVVTEPSSHAMKDSWEGLASSELLTRRTTTVEAVSHQSPSKFNETVAQDYL